MRGVLALLALLRAGLEGQVLLAESTADLAQLLAQLLVAHGGACQATEGSTGAAKDVPEDTLRSDLPLL
ncbi:hypothetical protein, partial [Kocuria arenosa]|uniref:hypothetical protein n=1 Tax=Kocuria arenosa TaxID=3071446 RepID=UPI0034D46ECA